MLTYQTADGITWRYTLSGSNATIGDGTSTNGNGTTSGTGLSGAITIPDKVGVEQYTVTGLGLRAFYGCTGLTSVVIGNSVTFTANSVFNSCSGLKSVVIGNSVTTIGWYLFESCTGLTTINIPTSVTTIGANVFRYCTGLTAINIPTSVTSIGGDCFTNTSALLTVTMKTQTISSVLFTSPTTTDISFFGNPSVTLVEPPLSFVDNTLTIQNSIDSTNVVNVSFQLPAGSIMYSFNVTSLLNATSITYSLNISGGANVSTGTITTTGVNLLGGNNLTPAVDTTYILTLTSSSTNTYTIIGKMLGPGYTFSSVLAAGGMFNWNSIPNSNAYAQTYVTDFVDLSGNMIVRHDGKLTVGGDASFNAVNISSAKLLANDLAITSRLFVGDNVSIIGNMKVGNDLSANGQFSGNFAPNLIPTTAIINYPSSGSGSTVITGNVRIAGDVSFNGATVDLSTNTVLQVDDYITFNDGSTMNSFDDLKSRMFDMSASLVTTTTVACVAQERQRLLCSSDGKYVAFNTTTGLDISQDYGATFTRKYLTDPANQMPSVSVCSNLSISLTGQYMICSCYGEAGEVSDYILVGFSNDYGTTWSTAYLKLLIGSFPAEALFLTGVAISSDGATMIMDVRRSGLQYLYKTTSKSLSGFTLINTRTEYFAENTLKLVKAGGVEYIVAQRLDSGSPGRLVIYNLAGTLIHTSAINYGGSTDISIPFNAINTILTGPAGQLSRVDCREDFVYNNPMVTDISTIYSGDTRRKSSAQSPLGKHILVGPFVASGTFINSRYNCPDIKDANGLRYSTNGGYRFKQVSGLVSTTFTSVTSMALSDRGHIYIVDDIGPGQVKYVAATFELMRNVTFKKVDVNGAANVTGSVTTSSDYRIKQNVSNLNDADRIDNLVPIQYNNILTGKHEFGLLAHDLQSIYPELVEGEKDGAEYQRVDYNGLIGVLVKEVQDLKKRVAVLNQ